MSETDTPSGFYLDDLYLEGLILFVASVCGYFAFRKGKQFVNQSPLLASLIIFLVVVVFAVTIFLWFRSRTDWRDLPQALAIKTGIAEEKVKNGAVTVTTSPSNPSPDDPYVVELDKKRFSSSDVSDGELWRSVQGITDVARIEEQDTTWRVELSEESVLPDQYEPYELTKEIETTAPGRVPLGKRAGDIVWLDFGLKPHLLIAGASGSGKSVLLSYVVEQYLRLGWSLYAVDPHGDLPLDQWGNLDDRIKETTTHVKKAEDVIGRVESICRERLQNRGSHDPLLLVVDELPKFLEYEETEEGIRSLLDESRKADIRIISAMQSPSSDVIDTTLRLNFSWKAIGLGLNAQLVRSLFPGRDDINTVVAKLDEAGPGAFAVEQEGGELSVIRAPYSTRYDKQGSQIQTDVDDLGEV